MKEYNYKSEKSIENANYIHIFGKINGKLMQTDKKRRYSTSVETERKSGTKDILPVITEDIEEVEDGGRVEIWGRVKTRLEQKDGKNRKLVYIWAEQIRPAIYTDTLNEVYIEGTLCKDAIFRKTPKGREVTDLMIACNGSRTSSYIPCVCFGMNARRTESLKTGAKVCLWGRMQSRVYKEIYTAYEIAVDQIEVIL